MDKFVSLKWLWSKPCPAEQHDLLNDATFDDTDELDIFYNHLNEIDAIHRVHTTLTDTSDTGSRHIDPRIGQPISRHLIVATFDANPTLSSALGGRKTSRLARWQHMACLRILRKTPDKKQSMQVLEQNEKALKIFQDTASQREAEKIEFNAFAREHFEATAQKHCAVRPFFSELIATEWQHSVDTALEHYAGRWFQIQTAIPLDPTAGPDADLRLQLGQLFRCGSAIPAYKPRRPQSAVPLGGRVLPSRTALLCPKLMPSDLAGLMGTENATAYMSVNVLRQLINYPANSTDSWAVAFEIVEQADGRRCCVFDELLPDPAMTVDLRNRLALRRQLIGSTLKATENQQPTDGEGSCKWTKWYRPLDLNTYCARYCQSNVQAVELNSSFIRTVTLHDASDPRKEIRLLVHSVVDGIDQRTGGEPSVVVNISAKPENQVEFGAEQMGQGELVNEWCRQVFYPDSVTDRYRMDVETGTILNMCRLSLNDIEAEMLRLYALTSDMLLTRLFETMRVIGSFPCQQYLLKHSRQADRTARIYGQTTAETPNAVTVAQVLSSEAPLIPIDYVSWLPIDDSLVTRIHNKANVLPCMFPHKQSNASGQPNRAKSMQLPKNDRQQLIDRAKKRSEGVNGAGGCEKQSVKRTGKKWLSKRSKRPNRSQPNVVNQT